MSENVVPLFGVFLHDEEPADVLEKAKSWGAEQCMIIGVDEQDALLFGASTSEMKDMLWMLARATIFVQDAINKVDSPKIDS